MAIEIERRPAPAAGAHPHASGISDSDFERVARLVTEHSGIKLPEAKRLMVEGRLRRRATQLSFASVGDYCAFLFRERGLEQEFQHVVDVVTTNKTDFFREPNHFRVLEQAIIPSFFSEGGRARHVKLWSAASSNGAEVYTIAMVMADLADRYAGLSFAILGTDISTAMVRQARTAIYPRAMVGPVATDMQRRYLMFDGNRGPEGKARIVPELRMKCNFRQLNLMDTQYPVDHDVDVIFVRNVLIYFEPDVQEAVVRRLWNHLRPGGFLMLGHSESMIGTKLGFRQVASAVFQKNTA